MIEDLLIHSCDIRRPTHGLTSQTKTTGSAAIASGVRSRFHQTGSTVTDGPIGLGASETWKGWFPSGTDLKTRDLVTVSSLSLNLTVESVEKKWATDGSSEHHLEVILALRAA